MDQLIYQIEHFGNAEEFKKGRFSNIVYSTHLHRSFEFIFVYSGMIKIRVGEKSYELRKGESILIVPNQVHSFESKEDGEHMLILFSPELVNSYSKLVYHAEPTNNKFILNEQLIRQMENLPDNSSIIEQKGFLYSLCAYFDKKAEYIDASLRSQNILSLIFSFIEKNFDKDCCLDAISKEIGYSQSYISRYFKKMTNIPLYEYLNQFRISNACYLLTNTTTSILSISLDVGFNSLRSFNRNFKYYTNKTPQEYRKEYGSQAQDNDETPVKKIITPISLS